MPRHAIDKLWTTDLDVNLFFYECKHFIKSWCKLKFSFFDTNAPAKMQMRNFISRCKMPLFGDANTSVHAASVPYRDADAKFIHDDANVSLRRCGCDFLFFQYKMLTVGMPWYKCQLTKNFLLFSKSRLSCSLKPKCFPNSIYFFEDYSFLFRRGLNASASFLPQNMFYFGLKLPQKFVITVRNLRMGYQLGIEWSSLKGFIPTS